LKISTVIYIIIVTAIKGIAKAAYICKSGDATSVKSVPWVTEIYPIWRKSCASQSCVPTVDHKLASGKIHTAAKEAGTKTRARIVRALTTCVS
jgi:hypothetical protein